MTHTIAVLWKYLSSQQVDDLEGVLDDANGHQLLAVVAAVHHHGVGQTLHDGALSLAETLGGITSSRVWQVLGVLLFHSNIILQRRMTSLSIIFCFKLKNSIVKGRYCVWAGDWLGHIRLQPKNKQRLFLCEHCSTPGQQVSVQAWL